MRSTGGRPAPRSMPREGEGRQQRRAGGGGDASRRSKRRACVTWRPEHQIARALAAASSNPAACSIVARLQAAALARFRARLTASPPSLPGRIGRQDQRRDAARRRRAAAMACGAIAAPQRRPRRRCAASRIRPRERLDIGRQRRVEMAVKGRVVADDIDQRHMRAARVVQIGQGIRETWPQMKQRARRLSASCAHSRRRRRRPRLRKARHAAHRGRAVQSGDEVNFGRAGIHEADVRRRRHQRADQAFRAVHSVLPFDVRPDSHSRGNVEPMVMRDETLSIHAGYETDPDHQVGRGADLPDRRLRIR